MMIRLLICIFIAAWTIYLLIEKQNALMELQLAIPVLEKDVKRIEEENTRLKYEIQFFESPTHLLELAQKPEFSHLKFPYQPDVILLPISETLSKKESP